MNPGPVALLGAGLEDRDVAETLPHLAYGRVQRDAVVRRQPPGRAGGLRTRSGMGAEYPAINNLTPTSFMAVDGMRASNLQGTLRMMAMNWVSARVMCSCGPGPAASLVRRSPRRVSSSLT